MKRVRSLEFAALLLGVVVGFSFLATQAQAIAVFFDPPLIDPFGFPPGDQITVDLRLDTEGEINLTSVFLSVKVDPIVLSFASGTSPGQILFDPETLLGLGRVSQPYVLPNDPVGTVRAASFAALGPSDVASSSQLLATLTFDVVGLGLPTMSAFLAPGDDVTVNGVSVNDSIELGSIAFTPEPGTALLVGLGLAGLSASGRRPIRS